MRAVLPTAASGVLSLLFLTGSTAAADPQRQNEVAARGAEVMPFKLSATTHVFTKTATGGLQQVVAKDPKDNDQIAMIRTHLAEIAQAFQHGDFSGPTQTHGAQMPGLARLKAASPGELAIRYRELANGAQVEYSSRNSNLISAIHEWFDAQLSDHGADAMAGHDHMAIHNAGGSRAPLGARLVCIRVEELLPIDLAIGDRPLSLGRDHSR